MEIFLLENKRSVLAKRNYKLFVHVEWKIHL